MSEDAGGKVAHILSQGLAIVGKKVGHSLWSLAKMLVRTIGPFYTAMIVVVLTLLLLLFLLVMSVYGAMTGYGLMTGAVPSQADAANIAAYKNLADKWNVADAYVVPFESWMFIGDNDTPKLSGVTLYPGKGRKIEHLDDAYESDQGLKLDWGTIQAVRLWWSFKNNSNVVLDSQKNMKTGDNFVSVEDNVPADLKADAVASALHPYFYYIVRTWTTRTVLKHPLPKEPSSYTDIEQVHLLVEAQTIQGWYQYFYTRTTKVTDTPNATVTSTYDKLDDSLLVKADKYERLRDYLISLYRMQPDQNADLMREFVSEAGTGFTEKQQNVTWLLQNYDATVVASVAMIPPDLCGYFQEAGQRYGIPWYLLAALAATESSFDSSADNGGAGGIHCYGLMQVSDDIWDYYSPMLGFNPPAQYRDDPRAQILVGTAYLSDLFKQYGPVDWNSGNWEEQTLKALTFYGGFRTSNGGLDEEACKTQYAEKIWGLANGYAEHGTTIWPVPGPHIIREKFSSSDHGVRISASPGDNVISISGGFVKDAGSNYITVSDTVHDYRYGGLGTVDVAVGQAVEAGITILGSVGSQATASSAFVSFDVYDERNGVMRYIDPVTILPVDWTYMSQQ